MTIMNSAEIQAYAESQSDEAYEVVIEKRGQKVIPITDKHVVLAFQFFKTKWRPGMRFDFRELSLLSTCKNDNGPRDFTADGINPGEKLNPKQVAFLFFLWLAERAKRLAAAEV